MNDAATLAFIGHKAEIDDILARLVAHSEEHFDTHPDEINWAMSAIS